PADHVPAGPVPSSKGGERLLELVKVQARLREPDGCPWDREQTHRTLARHLLEETHELLAAIDADDDGAVRDELGDLLLQVTFHAQIAADDGRWDIDDVADGLIRKLIHRHPHVFGDVDVAGSDEVLVNWEKLKAEEDGGRKGVDEGIPASLPALARAAKVQRRAAGWGFEWRSVPGAIGALREELDDLERIGSFRHWIEDTTSSRVEPWRFGTALYHDGFPDRWDSNFLRVERPVGRATATELAAEADRALERLRHREFVFDDDAEGARVATGLVELGYDADRLVYLTLRREPDR